MQTVFIPIHLVIHFKDHYAIVYANLGLENMITVLVHKPPLAIKLFPKRFFSKLVVVTTEMIKIFYWRHSYLINNIYFQPLTFLSFFFNYETLIVSYFFFKQKVIPMEKRTFRRNAHQITFYCLYLICKHMSCVPHSHSDFANKSLWSFPKLRPGFGILNDIPGVVHNWLWFALEFKNICLSGFRERTFMSDDNFGEEYTWSYLEMGWFHIFV